jgi:hypothetical protein
MSARATSRCVLVLSLLALAGTAAPPCFAARIEAVEGKEYPLTKAYGPWMLMVASFHTTGNDGETDEGKSPEEAAAELVFELRQKGIPAYTYAIENHADAFATRDRLGQPVKKKNLRTIRSLCVMAGNYPSFEDERAQASLEWIKKYDPRCLQDVWYVKTPGKPTPLSGAFLTINPLLSAEEVAERSPDPLLRKLNSGVRHSLTENKGAYTLVVAHFGGKTFNEVRQHKQTLDFLKDNDLDDAAQQANDLAAALRQNLDVRPNGQPGPLNNIEAYVWHDRFESVVTVGAFSSDKDPAIAHFRKLFGTQYDVQTRSSTAQYLTIGGESQPRSWAFVPTPQVMRVPRLR